MSETAEPYVYTYEQIEAMFLARVRVQTGINARPSDRRKRVELIENAVTIAADLVYHLQGLALDVRSIATDEFSDDPQSLRLAKIAALCKPFIPDSDDASDTSEDGQS